MEEIQDKEILENVKRLVKHYEKACHIQCHVYATAELEKATIHCPVWEQNSQCNQNHCIDDFLYNAKQAARFGGSYVFFCKGSLAFWVSPITMEAKTTHILLAGPVRAVSLEEIEEDIKENIPTLASDISPLLLNVPFVSPDEIHSMSEILRMCASWASGYQEQTMLENFQSLSLQSDLFAVMQKNRKYDEVTTPLFNIEEEKNLKIAIISKNITNAETALNEIIGRLYYIAPNDPSGMKRRLQEIITIMSRATLEAGASDTEVWELSEKSYKNLFLIRTFEKIAYTMHAILHHFFDLIHTEDAKNYSRQIMRAIAYANENFNREIPLSVAAKEAHLSVSYFCKSFLMETGFTWTQYLNKVRMNEAKKLLKTTDKSILEIAECTGFEDQCYFSRTFKKLEGITPLKFKKSKTAYISTHNIPEFHEKEKRQKKKKM